MREDNEHSKILKEKDNHFRILHPVKLSIKHEVIESSSK